MDHEAGTVKCTESVNLAGMLIRDNATSGFNETAEVNRTTWAWFNATPEEGTNCIDCHKA